MKSIGSILLPLRVSLKGNERGELIKHFSLKVDRPIKLIGIRLAHYDTSQLYALRSTFNDRERTHGIETARKYFWWISRKTVV